MAADVIIRPAEDTSERRAFHDKIDENLTAALALAGRKPAAGSYLVAAVLAAGGLAVLALKIPPLRTKAPAVPGSCRKSALGRKADIRYES